MNITDEELLMIEHLTYLNEDVAKAAGINEYPKIGEFKNQSIYNIVNVFDSNAIAALEAKGDEPLFFILHYM